MGASSAGETLAVHDSPFKLKLRADSHNEQLAEVASAFDLNLGVGLLRRDRLDLHEVVSKRAIGSCGVRLVTLDSVLNLGVELAEFSPYLQVASGQVVIGPRVL